MSLESVFGVASQIAMVGWLILALTPYRYPLARKVAVTLGLLLAALYAALMGAFWGQAEGGFSSLAGVQALFAHPGLLLGGWIHYLAFDLLVGTWEREEAAAIGLSRWLLVPCLFLTFMFGPAGWLLFMAVRQVRLTMIRQAAASTT